MKISSILVAFAACLGLGCSSQSEIVPAAAADSGAAVDDAGIDDAGAPLPSLPQVISLGGPVMKSPLLIPVVWSSDPVAKDLDALFVAMGKTTYYSELIAEYGVGKATLGKTVRVTDAAPAALTGAEIDTWLADRLDGTHAEFPTPDANSFFVLIYPPGTSIDVDGRTSCKAFHGYHQSVALKAGPKPEVPYAVISRCSSLPEVSVSGAQYVAAVMSHEILEGLADPFPITHPAFQEVDEGHRAWSLVTGGEISDLCALQGNAFYRPSDFPYWVQKVWSNTAAKAGKDPCIPQLGEVYFNSAPRMDDVARMASGKGAAVKVPVGQERAIVVDLFADGPTSGPWSLAVQEVSGTGHLDLSFDRSTGQGGDQVTLTIKAISASAAGVEPFVITSSLGSRKNLWFGAVTH